MSQIYNPQKEVQYTYISSYLTFNLEKNHESMIVPFSQITVVEKYLLQI